MLNPGDPAQSTVSLPWWRGRVQSGAVLSRLGSGGPVWGVSDDTLLTVLLSPAGLHCLARLPHQEAAGRQGSKLLFTPALSVLGKHGLECFAQDNSLWILWVGPGSQEAP